MLITIRIIFWIFVLILLLVLVRLQVNWALACVIVVVESKWGLEPLWRSTYLTKGMRLVSLYLMLFFGAVIRVVWACLGTFLGSFSDVWKCLSFVLQIVTGSSIVVMFLLQNLASNTVLYMYCKALHGELAGEIAVVGRLFGISIISAIIAGLLLALDGEFAFVAFGEAVNQGIMSCQMSSLLFLVVGVSMALVPWLAAGGQLLASRFELHDVRSLLPVESETDDLQDHIIICGFGRVGQIIAQLLSERLIPFVALDVRRHASITMN